MIENIIKDMVESNTTGRLTDASKRFVARMKEKNEIKKLLVDNSRFFAGYEANADKIAADIANVLSEENLSQLAADLSRDSGYTFKARLEKWLTDLMSEYEIPHEEERLYATLAAARIAQGKQEKLYLGNLSSLRDWGYAKDYVECMWLILQNDKPEDFVIATGEQHSVREFCQLAFHEAGIELEFKGEGMDEKGYDKATGKVLVEVSPDFYRPTDVVNLWGDPTKAKTELGWNPTKTSFEELVKIMVEHDMKKVAVERAGEYVACNLEEYLEKGVVK